MSHQPLSHFQSVDCTYADSTKAVMALTNMGFTATATKPSQKRKSSSMSLDSDADAPPPGTKKAKASTKSAKVLPISTKPLYTAHDLALLSHADLIAYTMNLQKQLEVSKKSPASAAVGQELSPEDLKKKVEHLRTLMVRQIKKAMTWKPSCKTGSATFSQDFVVQSPQIIKKLFETVVKDAKNGKEWKMKKFSAEKFEVRARTFVALEGAQLKRAP